MIEWRGISYAPGYEISSEGKIRSWLPIRNFAKRPTEPRILKPVKDKNGYFRYVIRSQGKRITVRACIACAETWIRPRKDGEVVRHLDGTKDNDNYKNLAWGTPLENSMDSRLHGTLVKGEKVNTAKLKESDINDIRESTESYSVIAKKYGVTTGAIWHIKSGRTWKHVSFR